jgi:tRNA(Ile2) C34 agmatinyltransferase TiaS
MTVFKEIVGLFVCLGPILAVVAWLVWATRKPSCPDCHHSVSPEHHECPECGRPLPRQQRP